MGTSKNNVRGRVLIFIIVFLALTNTFTLVKNLQYKSSLSERYSPIHDTIIQYNKKRLAIIAAGQSNIDGRCEFSLFPSEMPNPNPSVRFCKNKNGSFSGFSINDEGEGKGWGFDAVVYNLLTNPAYGHLDTIYVMKKSMGATSIDLEGASKYHWTASFDKFLDMSYSLLNEFETIIRAGKESTGENFDIKVFIWHQGEGDYGTRSVELRYYDNLKSLIAHVRNTVGNANLPVITASISHKSTQYSAIIEAAQKRLAEEDKNFYLIDMSDAELKDDYHFNSDWSTYLGEMVYNQMVEIGVVDGNKVIVKKP